MKTQGQRLLHACRQRAMTYGDLLALRISTAPWKRLEEAAHHYLREGERLIRGKNAKGLVVFRVTRAKG